MPSPAKKRTIDPTKNIHGEDLPEGYQFTPEDEARLSPLDFYSSDVASLPVFEETEADRFMAWRWYGQFMVPCTKERLGAMTWRICRERQLLDRERQLSILREASEWVEISKGGLPKPMLDVLVATEDWNVVTGAMCIEGEWFDRTGDAWRERYTADPYRWHPTGSPPQPASAGKEPNND